jgi:hypothetical protein
MKFIKINSKRWINLDAVNEVRLGVKQRFRGDTGPDLPELVLSFSYSAGGESMYTTVRDPQEIEVVLKALEG